MALKRRQGKAKRRITEEDWAEVERLFAKQWSPEQISGRLELENTCSIIHEWIDPYVWDDKDQEGELYKNLRCRSRYRKKYGSKDRRGQLRNRTSIEERPDEVDQKNRIGDCEADTVMGQRSRGAWLSMVERQTKFLVLGHLKRKTADQTRDEQVRCVWPYRDRVLTITQDNGREFARHEEVAEQLVADIYFADPYASWERGLNENTNGLLRQYFPKYRGLRNVDPAEIEQAVVRLNHRPRKSLGYQTPYEAFFGTLESLTVALGS